MPVRNASMPSRAQISFVPPEVHALFIEFVRSKIITMCALIGFPPKMLAVDVAPTEPEAMPITLANVVSTGAVCLIVTAFGVLDVHHAGTLPLTVRHFGVNVSDTPVTVS